MSPPEIAAIDKGVLDDAETLEGASRILLRLGFGPDACVLETIAKALRAKPIPPSPIALLQDYVDRARRGQEALTELDIQAIRALQRYANQRGSLAGAMLAGVQVSPPSGARHVDGGARNG